MKHQNHKGPEQNAKCWICLSATKKRILADKSLSHHYVPVSLLEECVVKVVKENGEENCSQDNLRFERTRCNTPKYFEGTRIPTFQACLGKPRVICGRGTLTQFHQRVAIGRTRTYKDKQYMEAQMGFFMLNNGKSLCKGIIDNQEIRKVGLSETHASGNQEASTHND